MIHRIAKKPWIILSVCLAILGLTGILLLYGQLSRVSELDVLHSYQQAVEQTVLNLSDRMVFTEETMRSVLYDARTQASLTRADEEETLENQLKEIKDLREMVYQVEKNRGVTQVRMYLSDLKMITREGINFFALSDALELMEYDRASSSKGFLVWIGAHEVRTTYFQDTCITLACLYRSSYALEGRRWALILLDLSEDSFAEILGTLKLPDDRAQVIITDPRGEIMLGDGDPETMRTVLSLEAPYGFYTGPDGEDMAYITKALSPVHWSMVVQLPRGSLLNSRQGLRQTLTLLLFGLTLLMITLVGFILYALYAHNVRTYIRGLNEELKTDGGKDRPAPANRALFDLDRNITELLDTNKRLTEENYRTQLREREVTLQALQAQINPHFLYNTLDSINWMAMREGAGDVSDAITTLAEYFRLSLSRGRSIVTLREDIEIAKKYLMLYHRRYDTEFGVEWSTSDEALRCAIPKLTLQPLVENALQHGIFKRKEKQGGILRVTAGVESGMMVLEVWDNGPGLRETAGGTPKGYGLSNVRERLDLYFGGKYAMEVANAPQGGARVTVRVLAEGWQETMR